MTDELRELIERLREEAEAFGGSPDDTDDGNVLAALFTEAASELHSLSERNAELEGLLRPIAERKTTRESLVGLVSTDRLPPEGVNKRDRHILEVRASLTKGGK